jgi:Uma2 family endonuclease
MKSAARVTTRRAPTKAGARNGVPLLHPGDRLTVEEFRRRYEAMPELKKAELIEGVVYMPSAVRMDYHGEQEFRLAGWLFLYRAHTPGVQGGNNVTLRLPVGVNEPQPDVCLRIAPGYGGQSTSDEGYVAGGPELVAEVTASTASYDLHDKLRAYEKNGVQEYLVWRVEDRAIDWFVLRQGKYRRLPLSKDGIFRSKIFPGLWLDAQAMIAGDLRRVIDVLEQGIRSPQHPSFVKRLQSRRSTR